MVFIISFLFFILIYVVLIIFFTIGLTKLKRKSVPTITNYPFLSVVVPCRNEEQTLLQFSEILKNQNYPSGKFEVILVNDHSTDNTLSVLKEIALSDSCFRPLHLVRGEFGKKTAISRGIEHALGKIIITTDADCLVPENWMENIARYFYDNSLKLLIGGVKMEARNFFEKLQALEFSSLIGSGTGGVFMDFPFLANGANLAFPKKVFEEADLKPEYASGDDIFLLQAVKIKYGTKSIRFLSNNSAIVTTQPQKTIKAFFSQRIRWLSKHSGYSDWQIKMVGIIVFFGNIALFAGGIWLFTGNDFLPYFSAGFGIKFLVDFTLLFFTTGFLKQKNLLIFTLPLTIIYPVYLFLVSLCSIFINPEWKGRKIRKE